MVIISAEIFNWLTVSEEYVYFNADVYMINGLISNIGTYSL